MIIFAHEFCSDMFSCARYCSPLLARGYDVFTFDFRGHGRSACEPDHTPRQWVTDRELHDMRGAVAFIQNWLEERGLPKEVGIFGISRGACAAILASVENPEIRAIVADGAFSTDTTIEYFMKRWAYIFARVRIVYENHPPVFWRFLRWAMMYFAAREFKCRFPSVRKAIQRMTPRPILFIHGEKDSYLPVEYASRRLYALAGQPKYLWVAPGSRHNQAVVRHADFYAWLTTSLFDRHLARMPQAWQPADAPPIEASGAGAVEHDLAVDGTRSPG
jgi:pimeloyl-ACP methyl ester carboxylesterase